MSAIDLSLLKAPDVISELDFGTILQELKDDLLSRDPQWDATVESDPVFKLLEVSAYREMILRQRVNEAAKAVMLAFAAGTDLDHLAALQNVDRLEIAPGDQNAIPPVAPTYEADERLRYRVQLAPEGQSVAGPSGSYQFHAISADAKVKDVGVDSPIPGDVLVTVLATEDDGTPSQAVLDAVTAAISAEDVRPLNDIVIVQSAGIINYGVTANLYLYDGPDSAVVLQAAQDAVEQFANDHHRLGHDITISGLYAALHRAGVQRVELTEPLADISIDRTQAAYCINISLEYGGVDE